MQTVGEKAEWQFESPGEDSDHDLRWFLSDQS
jgi:hypothetical protein